MKTLKRSVSLVLVILLILFVAAGCSTKKASTDDVKPGDPVEKIISGKISWLMRSTPFENKWEQEVVIPKFKKLYPGVDINLIITPAEQVDPKLLTMVAAGSPPDVFSMWGTSGFMDYYNKDLLLDLTPYIRTDIKKEDYVDGIFDIYAVDGNKYFSFPQITNFSLMIAYNKTLFKEAGLPNLPTKWGDPSWTWDTMRDYAKKLTKNYGKGANAQYGISIDTTAPHQLIYQFGADNFLPETYKTGVADKSNFDDPAVINSLQKIADLIYVDKVSPTPAENKSLSQMGPIFKTGKVAMTTTLPTQAYGNFKDVPFEWGLAPLPSAGANRGILFNGAWFIAKQSKSPDAAWALLKYLNTPENAKDMMDVTGFLIPLKEAVDPWVKLMSEETKMTEAEIKEAVMGYPSNSVENINHLFCGYSEISTVFQQGLDALWLGKSDAKTAVGSFKGQLDETMARIKKGVKK